jgi:hypothetical protein
MRLAGKRCGGNGANAWRQRCSLPDFGRQRLALRGLFILVGGEDGGLLLFASVMEMDDGFVNLRDVWEGLEIYWTSCCQA